MGTFETTLFQYMNNLKNYMRAQPLNLGGVTAVNGGSGGPPGGFAGYLPQSRIAYDLTEAESDGFVSISGYTLVDNLNHIRYRIKELEDAPGGSLEIQDNDVQVATGVTTLNFEGAMSTFDETGGKVTVTISGGGGLVDHADTHITGGGDTIADAIAGGNAGLMSGADKTKLDGIESGAEVNNISDVNATDLTDGGTTTLHSHAITYSGDVNGPASSTDHALVRFDGTDGKTIQDSTVVLDDSGNMYIGDTDTYISTPATALLVQLAAESRSSFWRNAAAGTVDVPVASFYRARNTFAVPSGIMTGDDLGRISFVGHNGTSYQPGNYILVKATEDWDGDGEGNAFEFYTTISKTTAPSLLLTLGNGVAIARGGINVTGDSVFDGKIDLEHSLYVDEGISVGVAVPLAPVPTGEIIANSDITTYGDFLAPSGNVTISGDIEAGTYTNLPVATTAVKGIASFSSTQFTVTAGAVSIQDLYLKYQPTANVIINDAGSNYDFTIEGDNNPNLFVLDAGFDIIGIGAVPTIPSNNAGILQVTVTAGVTVPSITTYSDTINGGGIIAFNSAGEETTSGGLFRAGALFIPSTTGKLIGSYRFGAYYQATTVTDGASIKAFSAETWDATHAGSYLTFNAVPTGGSLTSAEVMRVTGNGVVNIVGTATASFPTRLEIRDKSASLYSPVVLVKESATAGHGGGILFKALNDNATPEEINYGGMNYTIVSPTDGTEEGKIGLRISVAGALITPVVVGSASTNDGILQVTGVAGQAYPAISAYNNTAGGGIASYNSLAEGTTSGGRLKAGALFIPSATDKLLGSLRFGAYRTGTTFTDGATIEAHSAEAWSNTAVGSYIKFMVATNASTTRAEVLRLGDGAKIGFFGVAPVVRPSAYTQTYSTASKTVPNNTASAPPAGGTGATAGAYDTAANRNLMITSLTNCITDVTNLKKVVTAIIDDLQALGLLQ